ncbi:Signal transduction histidine kinase [Myxococcus fulvus]|uniref:histidine kinase n=1 Tax=Myxococcus fulvus TaxID=33 RepID=A0ABY1CX83_MYXFU|nr:Signal transduction histidine kinase [Myxococcus fulvus]
MLRNVLRPDVVCVSMDVAAGESRAETHWPPVPANVVREACQRWCREAPSNTPWSVAHPLQPGSLRLFLLHPEGLATGTGVVVVGSAREDFPNQQDRYLLQVAVGQAVISINDAELLARERRARSEAQEAVRLRDEFLTVAAHELRTPLTSLRLQHELMARALPPEDLTRVKGRLLGAQRQVSRLSELVDSLMNVSRITAGKLQLDLTDVDLVRVVREAVERLREIFHQAGCDVEVLVEGPISGQWDAFQLGQVVVNLLTNAAKYGAGKPIRVVLAADAEHARITVRDEGIGIAPEALPRLFGKFERAVSERHYGGLGIGLFICRQVVEALGGHISVESTPMVGSSFTVVLPRVVSEPGRAHEMG